MLDDLSLDYDYYAQALLSKGGEINYDLVMSEVVVKFVKEELEDSEFLDLKLVEAITDDFVTLNRIAANLMLRENILEKLEEKMKAKYAEKADREKLKKLKIEVKKLEEKLRK